MTFKLGSIFPSLPSAQKKEEKKEQEKFDILTLSQDLLKNYDKPSFYKFPFEALVEVLHEFDFSRVIDYKIMIQKIIQISLEVFGPQAIQLLNEIHCSDCDLALEDLFSIFKLFTKSEICNKLCNLLFDLSSDKIKCNYQVNIQSKKDESEIFKYTIDKNKTNKGNGFDMQLVDSNNVISFISTFKNENKTITLPFLDKTDKEKTEFMILENSIKEGSLPIVQNLLNSNLFDKEKTNENNQTFLHIACQKGHLSIVKYLIEKLNVNINPKDNEGRTPLHNACEEGHLNIVQYLIENVHVNHNEKDNFERTPPISALLNNRVAIIRYFKQQLEVQFPPAEKFIQTEFFSKLPLQNIFTYLKNLNFTQLNMEEENFITIFTNILKYHGKENESILLLQYINLDYFGFPLDFYINIFKLFKYSQICSKLAELYVIDEVTISKDYEYEITSRDNKIQKLKEEVLILDNEIKNIKLLPHYIPIEYDLINAVKKNNLNIVKTIIEQDEPSQDIKNKAVNEAAKYGYMDILLYLTQKNPLITPKDEYSKAAITYAAQNGQLEAVKHFVEVVGTYKEEYDKNSDTTVHYASAYGHFDIIDYLYGRDNGIGYDDSDGFSPLYFACMNGYLDIIKFFIEVRKYKINQDNPYKLSLLHVAAWYGRLEIIQYLIEEVGLDKNQVDKKGDTPLHYASKYNHLPIVQYLIEKASVNENIKNKDGKTPLHYASYYGNFEIVKYLIEKVSFHPEEKDKFGKAPVWYAIISRNPQTIDYFNKLLDLSPYTPEELDIFRACIDGDIKLVQYLIEKAGADINTADQKNYTLLHCASNFSSNHIVEYLIQKGANMYAKNNESLLPIFYAVKNGNLDTVKLFIEKGQFNVNTHINGNKSNILHLAVSFNFFDIVKYLVENTKIDIEAQDSNQMTPLLLANDFTIFQYLINEAGSNLFPPGPKDCIVLAIHNGNFEFLYYLLDLYDNDKLTNPKTFITPLHISCIYGNLELTQFLVEKKHYNVEAHDMDGTTPLQAACMYGNIQIVRYLIEIVKVDVYSKDNNGNCCLHFPYFCTNANERIDQLLEVIKYLVEEVKIDVNIKNKYNGTPLFYACQFGLTPIIEYLLSKGADKTIKSKGLFGKTAKSIVCIAGNPDQKEKILRLLEK